MLDIAKKHSELRLPVSASVEDIMKALLKTPPPPAGDPSTRKQAPKKKAAKKR